MALNLGKVGLHSFGCIQKDAQEIGDNILSDHVPIAARSLLWETF